MGDLDPATRRFCQVALDALGHDLMPADPDSSDRPDVLIAATIPPGWDALTLAILVSDRPPPDGPNSDGLVVAYLRKPIHPVALRAALAVAARLRALTDAVADLQRKLDDRKVIERAKGQVARYAGLDEDEAYTRLRKLASVGNRKLVEVAQEVVAAAEIFRALEHPDMNRPIPSRT